MKNPIILLILREEILARAENCIETRNVAVQRLKTKLAIGENECQTEVNDFAHTVLERIILAIRCLEIPDAAMAKATSESMPDLLEDVSAIEELGKQNQLTELPDHAKKALESLRGGEPALEEANPLKDLLIQGLEELLHVIYTGNEKAASLRKAAEEYEKWALFLEETTEEADEIIRALLEP